MTVLFVILLLALFVAILLVLFSCVKVAILKQK